jgi:GNAT superfamily N-acetyltransferase
LPEDYPRGEDQVEISLTSLANDDGVPQATREQIEARLYQFYPLRRWWRRMARRWLLTLSLDTLESWGRVKKERALGADGRELFMWRLTTPEEYRAHAQRVLRKAKTPEEIQKDRETEKLDIERRALRRQQLAETHFVILEQPTEHQYVFIVHPRFGLLADDGHDLGDPSIHLYAFSEFGSGTDPSDVPRLMAEFKQLADVTAISIHDIVTGGRINQGYGSALMRALFTIADRFGVDQITGGLSPVDTAKRTTPVDKRPPDFDHEHLSRLIAFYEKHGFEVSPPVGPGEWGRVRWQRTPDAPSTTTK